MTHQLAAERAQACSDFIAELIRKKLIPERFHSAACDHAIEMNLLAKEHLEACRARQAGAGEQAVPAPS